MLEPVSRGQLRLHVFSFPRTYASSLFSSSSSLIDQYRAFYHNTIDYHDSQDLAYTILSPISQINDYIVSGTAKS
jgi:hypothetical protein